MARVFAEGLEGLVIKPNNVSQLLIYATEIT